MKHRCKLGAKKSSNKDSGDAYYYGPSSPEKGLPHEGSSRNVDEIATKLMTPEHARTTHDPPYNTKAPSFEFFMESEEGINLVVDLNVTPLAWAKSVAIVPYDENSLLTPTVEQEIADIPRLTLGSDKCKEDLMEDEPRKETSLEDLNCGDKLPHHYQLVVSDAKSGENHCVDVNFDNTTLPPSSISKVHTAVVLYNYYHRKMSPHLAFADAKRFFACAALSVGEDLLPYLNMVHDRGTTTTSGEKLMFSITDRAAVDACEIAEALDVSRDSPNIAVWPVSKVAVILFNPASKKCLVEYGHNTKSVWSFVEKEIDAAPASDQPTVQDSTRLSCTEKASSTNKASPGTSAGPYMLQQLAYSELEGRTGIKRSNLRVIDEDSAYSLSRKWTTTRVFILAYDETIKSNLVEISVEELLDRMAGPVFTSDPVLATSTVVDYYHILPYHDILSELLHSKWHSVRDENLEDQEANSKAMMQKRKSKVPAPKPKKQVIQPTGTNNNSNNDDSICKYKRNNKRKSEDSRNTASASAEDRDGVIPTEGKDSHVPADVDSKYVAKSGLEMDKNKTTKQSTCRNIPQDDGPTEAPFVDPVMKNGGLEGQTVEVPEKSVWHTPVEVPENSVRHNLIEVPENSVRHNPMEVPEESGGVTENNNDQIYDALQSIWKRQDVAIYKQHMLEERNAQYDMDIQTILHEGEMTPKVLSIIEKYKDTKFNITEGLNSYCSGEGSQAPNTKRRKLKEAILLRNPCQELDDICRGNNWILPRYTILPSVVDGMFHSGVRLTGADFDMSVEGNHRITPEEARSDAAATMIFELHKKATEETTKSRAAGMKNTLLK